MSSTARPIRWKVKKIFRTGALRMSWLRQNTLSLLNYRFPYLQRLSVYQQKWTAKQLLRDYHVPNITERQFIDRHFKTDLPYKLFTKKDKALLPPIQSTMFGELERRVDCVVFRSHFARSIWEARHLVRYGHVQVNGEKSLYPARRLEDGDIITVSPHVIPTLKSPKTKKDRKDKALTFNKIVALRLKQVKEKHMELEAKGLNRAATEENQTKERKQTEQKKPEENQEEPVKWTKSADAKVSDATKENDTSKELSDGVNEQKEPVDESSFDEKKEKAKIVADLLKEEPKNDLKGKHFNYIPYMSPWMFIPTYLEVDYATCSTVFLRSPLPQPKRMEIPSPYGPTYHLLAYEWYSSIKKSQTKTPLLPQIVISGQAVKLKPKFDQMVRRERKNRQSKDKAVEKEIEDLQLQSLKLKYQARSFLDEKYLTSNGPKNEKLIQDIITITSPSQL